MFNKPAKKTDRELFYLLEQKLITGDYFFTNHAKQRLIERRLLEIEIIDILKGNTSRKRSRNKRKDNYCSEYHDWNYCIEGKSVDKNRIRIVFSFSNDLLIIITVIN